MLTFCVVFLSHGDDAAGTASAERLTLRFGSTDSNLAAMTSSGKEQAHNIPMMMNDDVISMMMMSLM